MDANDAASYVQNLAGEDANIIFGAMYDDTAVDSAKITVIATGLNDATAKQGKRKQSFCSICSASTDCTGKRSSTGKTCIFPGYDDAELPDAKSKSGSTDQQYCSEKRYPDSGFPEKKIKQKNKNPGGELRGFLTLT